MSPLVSRVLVAAALLPVVLGAVWLGGWWLTLLAIAGGLIAVHELSVMARTHRPLVLAGFAGLVLTLLGAQLGGPTWLLGGLMATVGLSFLVFLVSSARQAATGAFAVTLLAVAWVGGGLGHLMLVRDLPGDGRLLIFALLFTVFADDTAAYFVGRAIGRHKLAPAISPGKSVEGFVGGTVAAVAVMFFALYDQDVLLIWESLVLGLVIALAATLGDLFESAVKRDLGVKDSGRILAGHGGVLDRVDSLLWAGPAAYYALLALGV
jgi:phosphatidate cytidylyltransferase